MSLAESQPGALRSVARTVRGNLFKAPGVYRAWSEVLKYRQRRVIEREQAEYRHQADRMGLNHDWRCEETQARLHARLAERGIRPVPKPADQLHVVYAGGHSPWDVINIVPGLRAWATVTPYLFTEHGFAHDDPDWVHLRERMNAHFVDFVTRLHRQQPVDLVLTYYSGHQIGPDAIAKINALGIVTAAYHLDDRLYFRGAWLGGRWRGPAAVAAAYDLNLTQAPESLVKYRVEGGIPFLWPLAANPALCYPRNVPFRHDVSFVGTAYGNRIKVIDHLRRRGIEVAAFGQGWPGGFLPADRFQEIYCASRINLNFDDIGYTDYQCGKIRDFEVPMCGGLMLSTHNEHLGDYFRLDTEIFTFSNPQECLLQIRRLLGDEDLCKTARRGARETALRKHTWQTRARELLQLIGFAPKDITPEAHVGCNEHSELHLV